MDIKSLIPFGKKNIEVRREEENPFAMMQREMNRVFDSFNRNWGLGAFPEFTGSFMPRLDVTEDAKAFTVTAELPGMSEKEIDLSISGDTLTIRGEKKEEREDKNKSYYYSERSYGTFMRSIPLPRQVETDKVSASFKKGLLMITLPKTAAAMESTKKIDVRTG
ncbi:MAG: Hsp20/alpha crystallin family protein [Nitrospirae bacterium]|nr:Hsp20/alpha crystallin family protein [Nitrospirota bacterium]